VSGYRSDTNRRPKFQRCPNYRLTSECSADVLARHAVAAPTADVGWQGFAITSAAVALMLQTRINPLWVLITGGTLGARRSVIRP
jgi:hypothetical protein